MTQAALKAQIKDAMMAKDELRLSVIRGLVAACTNELVAKGKKPTDELDEDGVMTLIARAVKQRKDSIEQFTKGGRVDLAEKETAELQILEGFLPAQMSEEEIEAVVRAKMAEMGPIDKQKSGQFIGAVMKDLKGKADGMLVKSVVDRALA
jgi:uncharacterized protein YqeY